MAMANIIFTHKNVSTAFYYMHYLRNDVKLMFTIKKAASNEIIMK